MNGVEASAYAGTSQHADGTVYDLSVLGGASNDKGSFILGAGYYDQKLMYAGARDWAVNALAYDYTVGAIGKGGSSAVPQGRVNGLDPTTCATALCTSLTGAFGPTKRNWIYDPAAPPAAVCSRIHCRAARQAAGAPSTTRTTCTTTRPSTT